MSNNFVCDMVVDAKGRLWVATESGLNAYNGAEFRFYGISNSELTSNMINCLWYDDANDKVWVGAKGMGVCCVDPESDLVSMYCDADSSLNNVLGIEQAPHNKLWLICPAHVMQLDPQTRIITRVDLGEIGGYFRCGIDDGNGNLLLGSHMRGASVLNSRTQQITPLDFAGVEEKSVNVNEIVKDYRGRIWIATNCGLWYYVPGSQQLLPFEKFGKEEVCHLKEMNDQTLWMATRTSLLRIDLRTENVSPVKFTGNIKPFQTIQCIHQDRFGNIWLGSAGDGIEFISHEKPLFNHYFNQAVWGLYAEDSVIWAGSWGHVLAFQDSKCIRDIDLSEGCRKDAGVVLSINGNGGDLIYMAITGHFLSYNKKTGKIAEITDREGRNIDAITFYREDDGTFWITSYEGVYTLQDGYAVPCQPILEALKSQSFHGVRRDKEGKLWVATYENGLYLLDKDYEVITHLSQQSGFFSNSIQHLKLDSQSRLWISTPDGLCCIPDTRFPDKYITYGYREGLRDTYIRAIQEDRNGNIWMSTNNGISMLSGADGRVENFNQSDYLPVNNMNGGSAILPDGSLMFNSLEGLCSFNPDSLILSRSQRPLLVFSVQELEPVDQNTSGLVVIPDARGVYHFDFDHSTFRLFFGCSDYAQSRCMEYEYRINDSKGGWIPCIRNAITFRNLGPDTYHVQIRARVKGQLWDNQQLLSVTLAVHHPWWWNVWAKVVYLLILLLVAAVLTRFYFKRMRLTTELDFERRKNIVEGSANAERLQFFTNVTHELKTPLTLLQAPLEEMLQKNNLSAADRKRIQLVYDSSLRLTALCNKLLEFRRSETHNLQLKVSMGDLGQLVQEVGQSFVELNTNPQLKMQVEVVEEREPLFFDADKVRSILTNLLSNAVKYTPKGVICLKMRQYVEQGRRMSEIVVSDTGYGIPATSLPHIFDRFYQVSGPHQASGTGIGLSIVKSMVDIHQAKIDVKSKEGEGTVFTLLFDGSNHYPDALHEQSQVEAAPQVDEPVVELDKSDEKPVILLTEDDTQILDFMAEALSEDYCILRAHNGQEGLELALQNIPDVVITDLMMPVMNGNILCTRLKTDLRTSHIPVIMLTAKDTDDDQMKGFEDGADIYMTKPFKISMLRTRLKNLLKARQNLSQWINTHGVRMQSEAGGSDSLLADFENPEEMVRLSRFDRAFLNDVRNYIIEHIAEDNLNMDQIARSMDMSHSTLYRKIKALTGLSAVAYLRQTRIIYSANLMLTQHCNVSEAAYRCGFSNLASFRGAFKEIMGVNPSEYQKQ